MNNPYVRNWLYRSWDANKTIETLKLSRQRAYEQAVSITSQLNGISVSGTKEPHKLESLVEYDLELESAENELLKIKKEIAEAINKMPTLRYRDVLIKRHLDCLTWERCSSELGYSFKQMKRNYKSAINEIEPYVKGEL